MPDNRMVYINARGQEIVLDDSEHSFLGELQGRQGFEAPEIKLEKVQFGNGSQQVLSAELQPREVTCLFWAETKDHAAFDAEFSALKAQLIQFGPNPGNWGSLRILTKRGTWVYLNCIYSDGLPSMVRDSMTRVNFSLTFHASDPLFYDLNGTDLYMQTYSEADRLNFGEDLFHFGADTHFRNSMACHEEVLTMDCYRVYPEITIMGPATNVMLRNVTTGKTIRFENTFSLLAGETLTIRTKPNERSVYWHKLNHTTVKAMKYLAANTSLDWYLINGANTIQFRNSTLNRNSYCLLSYQKGWLSAD